MKEHTSRRDRWRRSAPWFLAFLASLCLAPRPGVAEGQKKTDYSKQPGYVDFESMGLFTEEEAVVEIYLHDALLGMVSSMSKGADPDLSDMLSKLQLVRVQKFRLGDTKVTAVETQVSALAGKLEKGGWMRAVRVREKDENIYVYFKMGDKVLNGITVMAVDEDSMATFVNIVGDIDPEQIGRLGKKFDIDELDDLKDWEKGTASPEPKPDKK